MDRLTKYAHFLALSHPYTAQTLATVFLQEIHKLHGLPDSIISDRDAAFTSEFWREFFKILGTQLHMNTAYHPQSDGQTERVNRCLETYLRCMIHNQQKKWSQWLAMAEWWYNTTYHHSLKTSPFEALYGFAPPQLALGPYLQTSNSQAQATVQDRQQMLQVLKENLLQAQERMKHFADKHRSEREFQVGDMVF